jgi:hypothetical protein
VWKPVNAVFTRWIWNARAVASSVHAAVVGAVTAASDGLPDGVGDGLAVRDVTFGDVLGDADALGLGDASVRVIVVTPFDADTLTRAPVAPSRNTPEMAPDFAWISSESSFASISPPWVGCYVV